MRNEDFHRIPTPGPTPCEGCGTPRLTERPCAGCAHLAEVRRRQEREARRLRRGTSTALVQLSPHEKAALKALIATHGLQRVAMVSGVCAPTLRIARRAAVSVITAGLVRDTLVLPAERFRRLP